LGGTNTYTPDVLNRVSFVAQTGTGVSAKSVRFTYNDVGQFRTIDRFADATGTQLVVRSLYTYDELNRVTSLVHDNAANAALASYTYAYDVDGRTLHSTDVDGSVDYTYDHVGQLTGATYTDPNNPDRTYTWDANGNPTGSGFAIDPGNRLRSDGTFTYDYDGEGNLIKRTEIAPGNYRLFKWDERNRLIEVTDFTATNTPVQVVRYTYDGLDRRIAKAVDMTPADAVDAVFTHFVYDRDNVLLEFVDDDGSGPHAPVPSMRYLFGPVVDQVLAQENFLAQDPSLRVLWLLTDRLGSIRDLVDNSGTVRNHIVYDPFGNVIFQTHPEVTTRYMFAGREFDEETGLYFNRARYYDPKARRFLSHDPLRFRAGDANLYRYVKNDPVAFVDPSGKLHLGEVEATGNVYWDLFISFFVTVVFPDETTGFHHGSFQISSENSNVLELTAFTGESPSADVSESQYAQDTGGIYTEDSLKYGGNLGVESVFLIGLSLLAGAGFAEECHRRRHRKQAAPTQDDVGLDAEDEAEPVLDEHSQGVGLKAPDGDWTTTA
jgi:RHS repeat-associated protein